jgi:hypothetical protein
MFSFTAADPNVVGLIYFNFNKETDWKVWDGVSAAAGWRDGMQMAGTEYRWPLTTWFQPGPVPFSPYQGRFIDDDVSDSQPDIEWLARNGVVQGCTVDQFCPSQWVTRGELATFLVRGLGLRPSKTDYFLDDEGSAHEPAINALARAGITAGCLPERFCPDNLISRGQLAYFLTETLDLPTQVTVQFADTLDSEHRDSINAVVAAGLASGCGMDLFCPRDAVNRGQIATVLRLSLERLQAEVCTCLVWSAEAPFVN